MTQSTFFATACEVTLVRKRAPQWVQIFAYGDVYDGRPRKLDRALAEAVKARFDSYGTALSIDYRHETFYTQGGPAPQAAEVDTLDVRDDGLYGHVAFWTEEGRRVVEAKEYRFISPLLVWQAPHRVTGAVGPEVWNAGLTNVPGIVHNAPLIAEAVAALNKKRTKGRDQMKEFLIKWLKGAGVTIADDADDAAAQSAFEAHVAKLQPPAAPGVLSLGTLKLPAVPAEVLEALSLNADATVAEAVAGVRNARAAIPAALAAMVGGAGVTVAEATTHVARLQNGAPDAARFVALEAKVAEQEKRELAARVDALVAEGKIAPVDREKYVSLFEADAVLAETIVGTLKPAGGPHTGPLGVSASATGDDGLTVAEAEVAKQLGVSAEAMKAARAKQ